ncbi:MAG TPA: DUF4365 domain-containing protein [Tepidisphaeraceae bacterium]|nr:DUF4365 domain-containing protein [Tepidisphaeraceae bacterium]
MAQRNRHPAVTQPRKRRTRQHVIADLSINHIERHILLCNFTSERIQHDYGFDLSIFYDSSGYKKNGNVWVQLKATDKLKIQDHGKAVAIDLDTRDIIAWRREPQPVILIVYDTRQDVAYWLYVQAWMESDPPKMRARQRKIRVRLLRKNIVNEAAIRKFDEYNDRVTDQRQGKLRHV